MERMGAGSMKTLPKVDHGFAIVSPRGRVVGGLYPEKRDAQFVADNMSGDYRVRRARRVSSFKPLTTTTGTVRTEIIIEGLDA